MQVLLAAGGVNVYDIRKQCEGPLCYDFSKLDRYLAQESVRKALGVGERVFNECDPIVHANMMGDWMKNVRTEPSRYVVNVVKCMHLTHFCVNVHTVILCAYSTLLLFVFSPAEIRCCFISLRRARQYVGRLDEEHAH